jgi:predicted site-specific integrase-resolvase
MIVGEHKLVPVILGGQRYYQTSEACHIAGISRNTFLRWVKDGLFMDVKQRDRHGWRLFTEEDLNRLVIEVNRVSRSD